MEEWITYYVTPNPKTFQISEIYINLDLASSSKLPNVAVIKLESPFLTNIPSRNPVLRNQDLQIKLG